MYEIDLIAYLTTLSKDNFYLLVKFPKLTVLTLTKLGAWETDSIVYNIFYISKDVLILYYFYYLFLLFLYFFKGTNP